MTMRRLLVAMAGVALMACTEIPSGNPNLTGTYTLRSVNGQPLPFSSSGSTQLLDDAISLFDGATWSSTGHVRTTSGTGSVVETVHRTGPFTSFGTSLTLRVNETGGTRVGVYESNAITFIEAGVTSVYAR
jgi:hypothetical protein